MGYLVLDYVEQVIGYLFVECSICPPWGRVSVEQSFDEPPDGRSFIAPGDDMGGYVGGIQSGVDDFAAFDGARADTDLLK